MSGFSFNANATEWTPSGISMGESTAPVPQVLTPLTPTAPMPPMPSIPQPVQHQVSMVPPQQVAPLPPPTTTQEMPMVPPVTTQNNQVVEEDWEHVKAEDVLATKQKMEEVKSKIDDVAAKAEADARAQEARLEEEKRRKQQLLDNEEGAWGDDDDDDDGVPFVVQPPSSMIPSKEENIEEARQAQKAQVEMESPTRGVIKAFSSNEEAARGRKQDQPNNQDIFRRRRPDRVGNSPEEKSSQKSSFYQKKKGPPLEYKKPSWAQVNEDDADTMTLKKAKSLLNKLTVEKFDRLSDEFVGMEWNSEKLVAGAIDLIVDKAQRETHFVQIYAELCVKFAAVPLLSLGESNEKGSKQFRRMLLLRCQAEFERDPEILRNEIEQISDPEIKENRIAQIRKCYIGHMFFIGALYKLELLREGVMYSCIEELFGDPDEPDAEKIECLAKLFTSIGKKLDLAALESGKKESQRRMKAYFKQIKRLATNANNDNKLDTRIRYLLRDLYELRENDWIPRRKVESAKTIAEIHREAQREEDIKAGRKPKKEKKESSSEKKPFGTVDDDGWETVGTGPVHKTIRNKSSISQGERTNTINIATTAGGAFGALASSKGDKKKKKKDKADQTKSEESLKKKKKKEKLKTNLSSDSLLLDTTSGPESAIDGVSTLASPLSESASFIPNDESDIDDSAYRAKAKAAIDEYAEIGQIGEVIACITQELDSMSPDRHIFVAQTLDCVLNAKATIREKFAPMLVQLASPSSDNRLLNADHIAKGFLLVLEFLPDHIMDISPHAPIWLGDVLKSLAAANATDLLFLDAPPPNEIQLAGDHALKQYEDFKSYVRGATSS
uniref:MI domain-containing protein n=1 Tax=Aureoumbra lagunensis TaxID=44058 RepID=A0A7S3NGS0_9STRA|mmetsp:Transcript_22638/g.29325  ORF Transcript_22638/g.29325 Transcript_22638/m.29325 type:complete len:838 (+) Transcript_22638:290-2803(+)|eukprot:CAMPEP_0197290426 /NCGR_PEP_ID=MMETSP0890-20130614/7640_1 /TAXON_ID=44058 ORGANISM="Aureoumbra lagunensis, Strain CCMP1510" /NCGR_SAMPLE_ID=MMETSP0890 /ASSEMBLY_ACC=CAM_ASM_000533 /LENGTH=837 /DNA_ID=CAMNT_0042762403 /DNA_START=288 /DNA_END=2801 /DNA_ORIENTATION=+